MVLYNGENIFTNFNGISPQNAILSFLIVAILRREEYADLNIILKDSLHDQSFTLKKTPINSQISLVPKIGKVFSSIENGLQCK